MTEYEVKSLVLLERIATAVEVRGSAPRAVSAPSASASGGPLFPPYGRSKGQPVAGATQQDLEFYRGGCVRSLSDPSKARFHDKERLLLAAIDDELTRFGGGGSPGGAMGGDEPPPHGDQDLPF